MKNFYKLFGIFIPLLLYSCNTKHTIGESIEELSLLDSINIALDYQIKAYPVSQYRDIYKNFMQDFFGPGHILADTSASAKYLRYELSVDEPFEGPLYEPTGYKGNFYRVNLSLIKDSIVPYDKFFSVFVRSVQSIEPPSGKYWMKTWNTIDSIILSRNLHFVNEEMDRKELTAQFAEGNYIVHHSQRYNDSVHFHYRIISKNLFNKEILPLINESMMNNE